MASPRPTYEPICEACGEHPALEDGPLLGSHLCAQCATDLAADAAELAREDCRVGLCCSNNCGGYCRE